MSLTEVISDGYDTKYVLGDWAGFVPRCIGRSDVIDAALDCFLNSTVAYVYRTPRHHTTTYSSNSQTFQRLRVAILASRSELVQNDVLIAINLLYLVEVCPLRTINLHQK
jgi:hypothetical protein